MMTADKAQWEIILGELDRKLEIRVESQSAAEVVASMPVSGNTQSLGRLHGGASAALTEAVGSWAGMIHASGFGMVCVGVDLNITHHRGAREGRITGTAVALYLGRRIATYEVRIEDEHGELLATGRISNLLVDAA